MPLFVYGTLLDPDVRQIVMQQDLPPEQVEEASIHGFRRVHVPGRNWPMLLAHHGSGRVDGMLLHGLDAQALHRLVVFEGEEYHLVPMAVTDSEGYAVRAGVFVGDRRVPPGHHDWFLEIWVRRHKRIFLRRAAVLMERYGSKAVLGRLKSGLPVIAQRKEPKMLSGKPPAVGRFIRD